MPANLDPAPVDEDVAEEIHYTSGQHHIEHLVAGPSFTDHPDCLPLIDPVQGHDSIEGFAYIDGRFMYAGLCNELAAAWTPTTCSRSPRTRRPATTFASLSPRGGTT